MPDTPPGNDVVVYVRTTPDLDSHMYYLRQMRSELTSSQDWNLRAVFLESRPDAVQERGYMIRFLRQHPEIKWLRVSETWSYDDDDALAELGRHVRLITTTGSWVPESLKQYGR